MRQALSPLPNPCLIRSEAGFNLRGNLFLFFMQDHPHMNGGSFLHFRHGAISFTKLCVLLMLCAFLCCSGSAAVLGTTGNLEVSMVYSVGDVITLGGSTNLAPGTELLVTVEEVFFQPEGKGEGRVFSGTSGTVVVQDGPPFSWSYSFSTTGWSPGTYLFIIEAPAAGITKSVMFSLIPAEEGPDSTAPSPPLQSPLDTPVSTQNSPLPSPTTVPFSPAVEVAGFVLAFFFRGTRF